MLLDTYVMWTLLCHALLKSSDFVDVISEILKLTYLKKKWSKTNEKLPCSIIFE